MVYNGQHRRLKFDKQGSYLKPTVNSDEPEE